MEELINAVDKVAAQRQAGTRRAEFALERLMYMPEDIDSGSSFLRTVSAARIKRAARFTENSIDTSMDDLMTAYEAKKTSIVDDILAKNPDADLPTEEKLFTDSFRDLSKDATRSKEQQDIARVLANNELEGLSPEEASRIKRKASIIRSAIGERAIGPEVSTSLGTAVDPGLSDDFAEGLDAAIKGEDYSSFIKTKFTRFSEFIKSGTLKELFNQNDLFRNSIYATTALVAASFAYQAQKDHTSDSIKGPPLLPGGSAYEQGYPQRLPDIPQIGTVSYNPGVSYKVNLYGNRSSVRNFQDMAMELGNYEMDTTIYSGIRQVGVDPYQQLASSY